jgi:Protein of unknown function DUF262
MKKPFRISRISEPDNSAWKVFRTKDTIQIDPEYQRASDIWTEDKRQLLIDTILNGFDVPKIYFHKFTVPLIVGSKEYEYAILDGKQRLEAIWEFIEGKFALSRDFECLWDPALTKAAGQTYSELGKNYPDLRNSLDSYGLTVVCIETDDIEVIEDMFSRLNEAVPLSAAEKRNAKGGPIPIAVKGLANTNFFLSKVPFGNNRYRHFDLAAKFLLSTEKGLVPDTKKRTLDKYVIDWAQNADRNSVPKFIDEATEILNSMAAVFTDKDRLLKQAGTVIVYFHLFRVARKDGWLGSIERHKLESFDNTRLENRVLIERGENGDSELVEFDRYLQSSNDAYAVKIRLHILIKQVFKKIYPVESL